MIRQEVLSAEIGQMIYDARTKAGLTQQQLANRLGTTQSVISRLESANYEGHSLSMLQRIAEVLGQKLELRLSAAAEEASPLISDSESRRLRLRERPRRQRPTERRQAFP